jgi:hypothetical protein
VTQHKIVEGLDETTHQGHCRHAIVAYYCMGPRPSDKCVLRCSVVQVHNERGSLSCDARAQGLGGDQVGSG